METGESLEKSSTSKCHSLEFQESNPYTWIDKPEIWHSTIIRSHLSLVVRFVVRWLWQSELTCPSWTEIDSIRNRSTLKALTLIVTNLIGFELSSPWCWLRQRYSTVLQKYRSHDRMTGSEIDPLASECRRRMHAIPYITRTLSKLNKTSTMRPSQDFIPRNSSVSSVIGP